MKMNKRKRKFGRKYGLWVRIDQAHWTLVNGLGDGAGRIAHSGGKKRRNRALFVLLSARKREDMFYLIGLIAADTDPRGW